MRPCRRGEEVLARYSLRGGMVIPRCLPLTVLAACLALGLSARANASEPTVHEGITFSIDQFPLDEQGPEIVDLVVKLEYRQGIAGNEYPDFEEIYKKLQDWMTHYPTKADYWEIFNKTLCKRVIAEYPGLASATLELTVRPSFRIPYAQTIHTTVTR